MNFDLKLGKAASVLFLALAMAGCGGGGGTTTAPPEPTPMPDPAIAEREAIAAAIGAAETAVAAVNDEADDAAVFGCRHGDHGRQVGNHGRDQCSGSGEEREQWDG